MTRSIKNLIAAVLIAVSGYFSWVEILPSYPVITLLKEQIEAKNTLLVSRGEIIKQIDKLRKDSNAKYAELQRLALVTPEKRGLPEIITAVENIYSRSGFILTELGLGDGQKSGQINKIGFKATAKGTYDKFLSFLGYFEKNIRLFDVNKVEVGLPRNAEAEGEINDPELGFTIDGQFYWLEPEGSGTGTGGGGNSAPTPAPTSVPTSQPVQ